MQDREKIRLPAREYTTSRAASGVVGRPLGVTIIAAWYVASAALLLCFLLFLLAQGRSGALDQSDPGILSWLLTRIRGGEGSLQYLLILLAPVLVGVNVAVGVGLWRLRPWARYASVVLAALSVLAAIWGALTSSLSGFALVGILVNALIVVYLFLPGVKEAFVMRDA